MMWFIIALVVGLVVTLGFWLHNRNVNLTWYEWLIGIVGLFLILFTIQNYFASLDELKNTAANYFLLITGLPGVVLLGLSVLLGFRRARA
jgi:hypothetical protein